MKLVTTLTQADSAQKFINITSLELVSASALANLVSVISSIKDTNITNNKFIIQIIINLDNFKN